MSDYLTDTEKFAVMTTVYSDKFGNPASFARKIGSGKQTVSNWYKRVGITINPQYRVKICNIFNLQHTVWTDEFDDEINFEHSLSDYQKISQPISIEEEQKRQLDLKIVGKRKKLIADEEDTLSKLAFGSHLKLSSIEVENKSPIFLFELSKIFKDKNQIVEALGVVDVLQSSSSTFKYTFHNEIEHFKAVLLSHNQVQKWDEAINILRLLYSASHYHLIEPEIITLMASNYKRKALSNTDGTWKKKEDVDVNLLANAFALYSDAYELKSVAYKYYDAVNMAYLGCMMDSLESCESKSLNISSLYSTLGLIWMPDKDDWWEVSSDAEMLMLDGRVDIAISKLNDFFEFNQIEKFQIETTLRQLEMYLHFVDDKNAVTFVKYLKEIWHNIDGKTLEVFGEGEG